MAARVLELLDWLAAAAARGEPATVFGELCERLRRLGIPLDRAAIQLDNLHPLYFGYCLHWYAGQPAYEVPRTHDFARSDEFALSPYKDWQALAWTGALIITFAVLALSISARALSSSRKQS